MLLDTLLPREHSHLRMTGNGPCQISIASVSETATVLWWFKTLSVVTLFKMPCEWSHGWSSMQIDTEQHYATRYFCEGKKLLFLYCDGSFHSRRREHVRIKTFSLPGEASKSLAVILSFSWWRTYSFYTSECITRRGRELITNTPLRVTRALRPREYPMHAWSRAQLESSINSYCLQQSLGLGAKFSIISFGDSGVCTS